VTQLKLLAFVETVNDCHCPVQRNAGDWDSKDSPC
jgi:hypothetical protein